jgi:CheY-like chemotaxis protein
VADPRRIKQILVNLLSNAIKFTPEQGNVELQVRTDPEQELIQFSVIDSGIGVALGDLHKLFQPFTQVDSSLNRQYDGTGLGLALVQKLTDLHGGSVSVESEVGKGSSFTVNLPWDRNMTVSQPATDNDPAQAPAERSQGKSNHATVLLAEDNMANFLTISEYLRSYGYEVILAHDGLEAINKAEQFQPDIILMDIQMPVRNGLEAISHLRTDHRFELTPIIALTALTMPGDRERCILAGASEYMTKPVRLKVLVKTIEKLLQLREASLQQ